jgi:hypothetical protein
MSSLLGIGNVGSAGSIDELIQAAGATPGQTTSGGGGFRKLMGGVVGGIANVFMPGVGGVIGNLIGGGSSGGLGSNITPASMLQMQQQMAMEQEAFTTASNVLKDRHDAAMTAIQNAKSN